MLLKPQDVLVTLKLACPASGWTYATLAAALGLSTSETHAAIRRAQRCRLLSLHQRPDPLWGMLHQFLIHGLPVVMPAEFGAPSRGMVTSHAAPPLQGMLLASDDSLAPVWPDAAGETRGVALAPLYPSVPHAARTDPRLHEWLAVADALRTPDPRTRQIAQAALEKQLRDSIEITRAL